MAATASQNVPAPSPSSNRPPERRSMEAAALASIAGWRRGRLATSGNSPIRSVAVARAASRLKVSR
jgi:hypothetical protein